MSAGDVMGGPCILCGHASRYHYANRCPWFMGGREHDPCDCPGYAPTVEVAQLRGFLATRNEKRP